MKVDGKDLKFLRWLISVLRMIPEGFVLVDGRKTYWKFTSTGTIRMEVYSLSKWMSAWWELELHGGVANMTWIGIGQRGTMKGTASIFQMLYAVKGERLELLSMDCLRGSPVGEVLDCWQKGEEKLENFAQDSWTD
tara:strand:- start:8345 stop:8752 length:408 start_codon:yes stop_codon:yes gene_type:complete